MALVEAVAMAAVEALELGAMALAEAVAEVEVTITMGRLEMSHITVAVVQ